MAVKQKARQNNNLTTFSKTLPALLPVMGFESVGLLLGSPHIFPRFTLKLLR